MKKILGLIPVFLLIATITYCQQVNYSSLGMEANNDHLPKGLNEGDKAPDFTGYDQTGKMTTLKGLLEKGPVVLFFYRGNWEPTCRVQLQNLQDSLNLITGQGFSLVAITPESIEYVEQTVKLFNIRYTVIYDCQEKMMQDYDGMFIVANDFRDRILNTLKVDIAKQNGREVAHLPVTATYIINKGGMITAKHFNPDFHFRASVKWILKNMGSALE
jgi:peroxiredoxin